MRVGPNETVGSAEVVDRVPAVDILKRPEVNIFDIIKLGLTIDGSLETWEKTEVLFDVESKIKYEGYIERHINEIKQLKKNSLVSISKSVDYSKVPGLSKEAEEKLSLVRPENLGQAMRVSGITPSDVSVLSIHLLKK